MGTATLVAGCFAALVLAPLGEASFPGKPGKIVTAYGPSCYRVWIYDYPGGHRTKGPPVRCNLSGVAFSPGGRRIAYTDGRGYIHLMHADGTHRRQLRLKGKEPAFTPNGGSLVYAHSIRDGTTEIYRAQIRSGKPKRLTHNHVRDENPDVSSVGHIAFVRIYDFRSPKPSRIWAMSGGGGNKHRVTHGHPDTSDSYPSFSPSGKRIVFGRFYSADYNGPVHCFRHSNLYAAFMTNMHGRHGKLLVTCESWSAAFSPNGRRVAFMKDGSLRALNPKHLERGTYKIGDAPGRGTEFSLDMSWGVRPQ